MEYKSIVWLLNNDVECLGLNFSYEKDNFGQNVTIDLKPNGRNIQVTNENKMEYVNSLCYAKMAIGIKSQLESFLEGLHSIVPKDLLRIFDPRE